MLLALTDIVTRVKRTAEKKVSVRELEMGDIFRHSVYGLHRVTTEEAVLASLEAGRRFQWSGHWYILKRSENGLKPFRLQTKEPFSAVDEAGLGMPIALTETVSVLVFLPEKGK